MEENPIDSLLLSAFEFIDVNEAGAANKILEDSATAHVRKVRSYFSDLSLSVTKPKYINKYATVEAMIRDATLGEKHESHSHDSRHEDGGQYVPPSKVEDYLQNVDPLK
jgi:hypothetical protein